MKVFVIGPTIWPIAQYEVDLVLQELDKSNESITILSCGGDRNFCPANPLMKPSICFVCKERFKSFKKIVGKHQRNEKVIYTLRTKLKDGNIKGGLKAIFGKQYKFFHRSLKRSVLSTRQTQEKTKGFRKWGYDKNSVSFWLENLNVLNFFQEFYKNNNVNLLYIFNGRLVGYKSAYVFGKFKGTTTNVYEHPFEVPFRTYVSKNALVHDFLERSKQLKCLTDGLKKKESLIWKLGEKLINGRQNATDNFGEWNFGRKTAKNLNWQSTSEKFVLITNSSEWETFGCDGSIPRYFGEQVRGIRETCRYFQKHYPKIKFVLRVHPQYNFRDKLTREKLNNLSDIKNLTVIDADSQISTYSLIDACHFVITFYSYTGPEATIRGKKVVSIGPSPYELFKFTITPKSHHDYYENILKLWNTEKLSSTRSDIQKAYEFVFARRFFGQRTKYLKLHKGKMIVGPLNKKHFVLDGGLVGKIGIILIKLSEKLSAVNSRESFSGFLLRILSDRKAIHAAYRRAQR